LAGEFVVTPSIVLLIALALGFYNVGTIWAMEVDIFRSWRLVGEPAFHDVQTTHWRKLPYWIFAPLGAALLLSIVLVFYHPAASPAWAIWGNLGCQALSHALTGLTWGRWQAALSRDPLGPRSPYLARILRTHWVRTALITGYGVILLIWAAVVLG